MVELPRHLRGPALAFLSQLAAEGAYEFNHTSANPQSGQIDRVSITPEVLSGYNPNLVSVYWDETTEKHVPGMSKDSIDTVAHQLDAEQGRTGSINLAGRLWNGFGRLLEQGNVGLGLATSEDFVINDANNRLLAVRADRAEALLERLQAVKPQYERGGIGAGTLEFFEAVCVAMRQPNEPPTS